MATSDKTQADLAWNNFLWQHHKSVNAENFVKPFYLPFEYAVSSGRQLLNALDFEGAEGARLDLIGSIVGASRYLPQGVTLNFFGFITQPVGRGFGQARMRHEGEAQSESYTAGDVEFKTIIRAKIALNNGHGTASEIEEAAKRAFNAPTVSARDAGPAAIELWVGRVPGIEEGIGRVIPDLLPRAAGVQISIVFWTPDLPFGFISNGHFGFGFGVMARTPVS